MTTQPSGAGAALDESGRPYDQIRLVGISATGYHGVFDHERREGQVFRADVVVHLDTRRAAATDDLALTLDYAVLAAQVAAVLGGEPADLIETVAERIAATALAHPAVAVVDVTVHKPQAPVTVPFDDIVVAIRRDHNKLPAAEPWTPPADRIPPPPLAPEEPVGAGTGPVEDAGSAALAVEAFAAAVAAAVPAGAIGLTGATLRIDVVPDRLEQDLLEQDRLEHAPSEPVEVVLALGANVGAAQDTLRAAVAALAAVDGLEVRTVSPLARTAPVGGPDQPDFLNAVVIARTTLSPRALLRATQAVETAHGRERNERWGPRTLDIDLIVYGTTLAVTDDLELPHPRAHQRAFVLQPWAQIAPDAVLPGLGGGPVAALAATAPDRDGIRWLALDWLKAPHSAPVPAAVAAPAVAEPPAPPVAEPADARTGAHALPAAGWVPQSPSPAPEPDREDRRS